MKRLLHIAIGLIFSLQMQAQTFPLPGFEAWYNFHTWAPPTPEYGYTHAWVEGDSIINGLPYHIFKSERITKKITNYTFPNPANNYSDTAYLNFTLNNLLIANSNDTIYQWYQNQKCFLWNNNANTGDIWKYEWLNNLGLPTYYFKVNVQTEIINGANTKRFLLEHIDSLGNPTFCQTIPPFIFSISDIMGPSIDINSYLKKLEEWSYACFNETHDESTLSNEIICWQADNYTLTHLGNNQHCMGSLYLSNDENTISELKVYPHPVHHEIILYNPASNKLFNGKLIDLGGNTVVPRIILTPQATAIVPVSHLKSGMYVLVLSDNEGNTQTHKIIKN